MAAPIAGLDGRSLSLLWCLPFAGLVLTVAILPALAPALWARHYGKIAACWVLLLLLPMAAGFGLAAAAAVVRDVLLKQYVPFIVLLFALFTISGGVSVVGELRGTPGSNTLLLALGTLLASIIGTAGASILLVRPLIRANQWRRNAAPVFVFFIFLVCNIGGALSPIGNPPIFLGFLQGVSFFWPLTHLYAPTLLASGVLIALFFAIDTLHYRREILPERNPGIEPVGIRGKLNLLLLVLAITTVLTCSIWESGVAVPALGSELPLQDLLRDALLIVLAVVSLRITHADIHQANGFSWAPLLEVGKLFAAIFLAIIPAIAILRAGAEGALAPAVALLRHGDGTPSDAVFFWFTGGLSSLLDNAPTYLMFFNAAGGDPQVMMGPLATTLAAISAGAQFMGAVTYLGNAPNFMVKSICEQLGIEMPSFLGYMAWSGAILLPLFAVLTLIFFRA